MAAPHSALRHSRTQQGNPGAETEFVVSKRGNWKNHKTQNLELVTGGANQLFTCIVNDRKSLNICKADGEMAHWKVKSLAKDYCVLERLLLILYEWFWVLLPSNNPQSVWEREG